MVEVIQAMEKYSRGRRGAPAKGVGRATGARVQIPLSPLGIKKEPRGSFFIANGEKELSRRFRRGQRLRPPPVAEEGSNLWRSGRKTRHEGVELRAPQGGGPQDLQIP